MPKLDHKNLGEVQKTAYLTGVITTVDGEFDTACFTGTGNCPAGTDIPIFYHCSYLEGSEPAQRSNGALEGAAGAFSEGDEVIVRCEIVSDGQHEPKFVMGFVDKPKQCGQERIYVSMTSSIVYIKRCFVWDIKENAYAVVSDNEGNPVTFPCDPDDISDWYGEQESVGEALFSTIHCGVNESDFQLGCDKENPSMLKEELSDCDPDFTNTGSCAFEGGELYDCRWDPVPPWHPSYPGKYEQAFDQVRTNSKHLLWGDWFGSSYIGSEKISFKNNCDTKSAFKAELTSEFSAAEHGMENISCLGLDCDNWIINREQNQTWKFRPPIGDDIFVLDSLFEQSGDYCNSIGQTQDTDLLVTWRRGLKPLPVRLKTYGVYSGKNIAQVYFVEIQTLSRNANCAHFWGVCAGTGCVGGDSCPWETEEYTFQGLKLVAQADTLTGTAYPSGTDGVDPTTLPRHSNLEAAVSGLYDILRADIFEATTGLEESDTIGASLNAFLILKGAINP